MKKLLSLALCAVLTLSLFVGCGKKDEKTIRVGASVTPHAEILKVAAQVLKEDGYTLEIVEFNDYVLPNTAVDTGELDANYFQHLPYLEGFNSEKGTHLVSVGAIHYEPFGLYPGKSSDLKNVADGATIGVPNDGSNEARALFLLQDLGLITLKESASVSSATVLDIKTNPKSLKIVELDAAQLTRALSDVDFAVINGNYAIQGGLSAAKDALAAEDRDSTAASTYANILCVKEGNENTETTKALLKALRSDKVKEYIQKTYDGAVVPSF